MKKLKVIGAVFVLGVLALSISLAQSKNNTVLIPQLVQTYGHRLVDSKLCNNPLPSDNYSYDNYSYENYSYDSYASNDNQIGANSLEYNRSALGVAEAGHLFPKPQFILSKND